MIRKTTIHSEASYGTSMTLGELNEFVKDARNAGIGDLTKVKVRVNFSAGIRQVSVTSDDGVKPKPETR